MINQITSAQLDVITADYNRAFAQHKQLASKCLLDSANRFMVYADCIESTMRVFGFVPAYNHDYNPLTGENFLSGWHRVYVDGE